MNSPGELIVVYTALFGSYEALVEQPTKRHSKARYICFTDDPALTSDSWEIVLIRSTIEWDSIRSARRVKILKYRELRENISVWIDNRVILKATPEELVGRYLQDNNLALPVHDHRATVRDEFGEVIAAGLDQPWRLREQLHELEKHGRGVLEEAPFWTAIILRRRAEDVDFAMETWHDHVLRYSRRDQLSINYAINYAGVSTTAISIANSHSDIHDWLRADVLPKRSEVLYGHTFKYGLLVHVLDAVLGSKYAIKVRNRLQRQRWALLARLQERNRTGKSDQKPVE